MDHYKWIKDSRRIASYQIQNVVSILDEAYWLLEQNEETLKNADRKNVFNPKEAQNKLFEAISKIENEWDDLALAKIDYAASDIEGAIKKINSLRIDVNLTPENGIW